MVDAWPSSLPQAMQPDGFSSGVADGRLRYKPDAGPAMMRKRTSSATRPQTSKMICTGAQLTALRVFVDTTLIGGVLPFTFPAQEDGSSLLVRFDDQGLPTWTYIAADYWEVSFKLEVLP